MTTLSWFFSMSSLFRFFLPHLTIKCWSSPRGSKPQVLISPLNNFPTPISSKSIALSTTSARELLQAFLAQTSPLTHSHRCISLHVTTGMTELYLKLNFPKPNLASSPTFGPILGVSTSASGTVILAGNLANFILSFSRTCQFHLPTQLSNPSIWRFYCAHHLSPWWHHFNSLHIHSNVPVICSLWCSQRHLFKIQTGTYYLLA